MTRTTLVRTLLVGALVVGAGTAAAAVPLMASAATTVYEAESATISQGMVATNHPGYTGTGFVDYTNAAGGYVQFSVSAAQAGNVTLTFRYANGSTTARPVDVAVNGTTVSSVSFAPTGDWATWKTLDVSATLSAGTNTVRATGTGASGGPNLDSLTVTDAGTPPPPPPGTDWSVAIADTVMAQHSATSLAYNYPDGLYLYGQFLLYQRTKDPKLLSYIQAWVDHYVDSTGHINDPLNYLDNTEPGQVILALYQQTKQTRYKNAAIQLENRLEHSNYPRVDGALQHATSLHSQLYGDGTFMSTPFLARFENVIGDNGVARTDAINNLLIYYKHLSRGNGLLWHAYDAAAAQSWVVPGTNHSPESWCRAMGWFTMATVNVLDATPASTPGRSQVITNFKTIAAAIKRYQDPKTGRWFQVVDKGNMPDDWTETSCSSMFTYALSRGAQAGYLDPSYQAVAKVGYLGPNLDGKGGVLAKISLDSSKQVVLTDISVGTSVGNYSYYIKRTRATNDFHGLGSFMIMNEQLRGIV